jgi:uncharacterized protein
MADMQDTLRALLNRHGLMTGADLQQRAGQEAAERASGAFEVDKVLPGEVVSDGDAGFFLVRRRFALEDCHGGLSFGAALRALPEHIAVSACDEELRVFDPRTAVFIDTETTGLSGGTGTVAFLVGVGYFDGDGFVLDQCFMRDYDDEEPMLRHLDGLFRERDAVVSYNGKSFDQPLLRTRFITNRIPFRLDAAMHFDLVHAARRFWKRRLGDCSLGNVERRILGVERRGDVPSHEIPQIWLNYLRTRDARRLEAVFLHHQTDILSLVALVAALNERLGVPEGQGFEHAEDRLSLLRIHFRSKRYDEATALARRLLEDEADAPARRECYEMLGMTLKRLNDWDGMEQCWGAMIGEFPNAHLARLELAKHHEHRSRNLVEAERLCAEAIACFETRGALGRLSIEEMGAIAEFRTRLARIRKKMARWGNEREP